MNQTEMTECIAFLDAFDRDAASRVRYAALRAIEWVASFSTPSQAAVSAATLAACELQCIVEAHRAERAGGIFIKRI